MPTLSFQTLEFLPYPFKYWNSYLIVLKIEILTLSLSNIGIPTLSFQSLECVPYPLKDLSSPVILLNIEIPTLCF